MKFSSKVVLGYFITVHSLFASENIMDRLNMRDIRASTKRLEALFYLKKDMDCSFYQDKAYITFGENLSNFGELLKIANTDKKELSGYSISGKVQKNAFDIFKVNEQFMLDRIKSYSVTKGIPLKKIKIIVEGYGLGTASAKLAAISVMDNLDVQLVNVLNYSPISIFDQQAADEYNTKIGKKNHINFIAQEDFIPPIFTGEKPLKLKLFDYSLEGDFKPVGRDINFSAYTSEFFCTNLREEVYPHLTPNFRNLIPFDLGVREWNSHIPELYNDISHVYFRRDKKLYLKNKNKSEIQSRKQINICF